MAAATQVEALIREMYLDSGKLKETFFKKNVLFDLLQKKDQSGGRKLRQRIRYAGTDAKHYSGLDTMPRTQPENVSYAEWGWANLVASIVIPGDEMRMANTKNDMIDLTETYVEGAIQTARELANRSIMLSNEAGAYAKGPEGFVIKFAAGTTACGGISTTEIATWGPKKYDTQVALSAVSDAEVGVLKTNLINVVQDGCPAEDWVDTIVTTRAIYDKLWGYGIGKGSIIMNGDSSIRGKQIMALGYDAINLGGVPVVVDPNCTTLYAYGFNSSNLCIRVHPDANFMPAPGDDGKPTKLHKLDDQDAYAMDLILMYQLTVRNRAGLAVCTNVDVSA